MGLVYKGGGGEGAHMSHIHGRNSSLIFPKVVLVTTEPYITSDIYLWVHTKFPRSGIVVVHMHISYTFGSTVGVV